MNQELKNEKSTFFYFQGLRLPRFKNSVAKKVNMSTLRSADCHISLELKDS
jgi:hypothetical protein